jgi:hypothetical protein
MSILTVRRPFGIGEKRDPRASASGLLDIMSNVGLWRALYRILFGKRPEKTLFVSEYVSW